MQFDLGALLHSSTELGCLSEAFSHEEIDDVVKNLPGDKSPGPDGFNTDFVKRCWPVIKQDFYELCEAFHQGQISLLSIMGLSSLFCPKWMALEEFLSTGPSPFSTHQSRSSLSSWQIDCKELF
jgi:hypothetical protein